MVDPLVPGRRRRVRRKNFNELPRRGLQVKPEQLSVLVKIKMRLQSERAAIKITAADEVFGQNADVGQRFDHGFGKDYGIDPHARSTFFQQDSAPAEI